MSGVRKTRRTRADPGGPGLGSGPGLAVWSPATPCGPLCRTGSTADCGRFYRADPSRTRTTGGAGLGLAIVRSLVTAHAGRVEVHTNPPHLRRRRGGPRHGRQHGLRG
ncbi:ATP-binding protein [Streptomyces mirabilis]|uniref:ATP-binding protein n=1 Tax=Streptomyces mirabilis TaxID=68239 RepID=UPI0009A0B48D